MGAPGEKAVMILKVPPVCWAPAAVEAVGGALVAAGMEAAGMVVAAVVAGTTWGTVVLAAGALDVGWATLGVEAVLLQPAAVRIQANRIANGINNFFNLFLSLTIFRITPKVKPLDGHIPSVHKMNKFNGSIPRRGESIWISRKAARVGEEEKIRNESEKVWRFRG